MAKLVYLLVLSQATHLFGLPTRDRYDVEEVDKRAITLSTGIEVTTSYSLAVPSSVQTASVTVSPSVTGRILTGLPSLGFTRDPHGGPTITTPAATLAPIDSTLSPGTTTPADRIQPNIFVPIATDAPPQQISSRDDHLVKRDHIIDQDIPAQTNKFYANFFLGTQSQPVWTHPYSLAWAKGHGETWGMAVSHVERAQFAWGPGEVPQYFIGPIGLQHIVFSAAELGQETTLSVESPTAFSVFANLAPSQDAEPIISIPCVQGMGFVTALYNNAKPEINSGTFFRTLEYVGRLNGITFKYRITLEDNSQWLLYATPVGSLGAPPFRLVDSATIEGPEGFIGMIQVAKNPDEVTGEQVYDSTAGAYAVNATISGSLSMDGASGSYSLSWGKDGVQNQTLLMFALPHHVESFDENTRAGLTNISLVTTTKGYAKAVVADQFSMEEHDLPNTIGFAPWTPAADGGSGGSENINIDSGALAAVNKAAALELGEDFDRQTRLDSMYYSGKGLAKFAGIIFAAQTMGKNSELAAAGLIKLKDAFNVFVNNTQPLLLVYDTVWKGVVSSGTYNTGDPGLDFGNNFYNDHHFHYGYFVWTAAVIGHLDPAWLDQGTNRAWVNMLVRDYANPSTNDPYYPFQRAFDWYHGHSWAKGLFESGDGKDQESSSEDTFATYALKMWGKISGDANMEARGNLQLAVQARSMRNYFLLASDNAVQPPRFLKNKVTGILFENKVDHTTYFGANIEFIQGIHMIPLNPSSAYTRARAFVQEEWDEFFSEGRVDQIQGGWRGILYANLALIDPQTAYAFFSDPTFDLGSLDGGASWTWYLAYAAAMKGAGGAVAAENVESQGQQLNYTEPEEWKAGFQSISPAGEGAWGGETIVPVGEAVGGEGENVQQEQQEEQTQTGQEEWEWVELEFEPQISDVGGRDPKDEEDWEWEWQWEEDEASKKKKQKKA